MASHNQGFTSALQLQELAQMDKRAQHLAIIKTAGLVVIAWVVIFLAYFMIPVQSITGVNPVLRFVLGTALVIAVLMWQIYRIRNSKLPELRAAEAVGVLIPLFLIVFATIYLSISVANRHALSQPLDHVAAIYFAITIFSTVGFGDITAVSNPARLLVSLQMILDLVLLATIVKVLFGVARNVSKQDGQAEPGLSDLLS